MNYSEVETKVREATNDDAWGPHGQLMQEIARYTFTYEHFPEVMGMLWKRMLQDNKKNWRRSYKALLLLSYLIRNGSERVVTSAREHLYDLRSLENYTFTDELGKDQGINVRQKVKDLLEFIQDDERLREERRKAKKNKDKFIGLSGDNSDSRYSDRYDEQPKKGGLDDIDDFDSGHKNIAEEAVDKVKDLVNRVRGRQGPDDIVDYSDDVENKFDDDKSDRLDFKDEEEYTSVERTHTTHTEKIVRSRSTGKKLDLGAAATYGKQKSADTVSQSSSNAPDLISGFDEFKSANDFNPRADVTTSSNGFADFSQFQSAASPKSPEGFADFQQFNTASTSHPQSSTNSELFDVFASSNTSIPSMQTSNMNPMMNNMAQPFPMVSQPMMSSQPLNMSQPIPTQPMMGQPMMNQPMMNQPMNRMNQPMNNMNNPNMMGMMTPNMIGMNNMTMQQQAMYGGMMGPNVGMNYTPLQPGQSNMKNMNTWSNEASKVNINLDTLHPANKYQKQPQPTMNQLQQQQGVNQPQPGMGMMTNQGMVGNPGMMGNQGMMGSQGMMGGQGIMGNQGMMGLNQGMGGLSLSNQGNMMGQPRPMMAGNMGGMGVPTMGMMGNMSSNTMGSMSMQANVKANAAFQKRTDQAFSSFGNLK